MSSATLMLACWPSLLAVVHQHAGHLTSRRAVVTTGAASLLLGPSRSAQALDVDAAVPVAVGGIKCKVSSCMINVMDDLTKLLDASSSAGSCNAKGSASMRLPSSVTGKKLQGLKEGTPTRIKLKVAFADTNLGTADNYVQMMWLAERDSGRVLSARAFTEPQTETAPRFAFDNRYTEEELGRVQSVPLVIRTYWSGDGLWELPAFTLGDLLKGEKGELVRLV